MPTLKVVVYNDGRIAQVYKGPEEEAIYAMLPPLQDVQSPTLIDLESNPQLRELADANNWHRYRINSGAITRDGEAVFVHPNTEAEGDRLALPQIMSDLRDFYQLGPLTTASTAAEVKARVIEMQEAIDDLIRGFRYIAKHKLKLVP